jgi:hypothetical protein
MSNITVAGSIAPVRGQRRAADGDRTARIRVQCDFYKL